MSYVEKEKIKLERGRFEIARRRLNWSMFVKANVLTQCKEFANIENEKGYPYHLFCESGSKDINAETIQFGMGMNYTGIVKVDSKINETGVVVETQNHIFEKNCSLVFSQGPSGLIMVLLYPYKSEVHSRKEDYIILYNGLVPEELTKNKVDKIINKFLFYARISSLNGIAQKYSLLDKCKLFVMNFFDVRNRMKLHQNLISLNSEWLKISITIILTILFTLIAQNFGVKT
ncbi:hypothetical protein [Aliivibrio fischeri]|uniref:hypothetical protein n=1 Tax=Aliivibrio fischeri TaxID=668 RepID=UPI00080DA26D|nr:hypothetical protein [Aliivibrio fischeri]OCH30631.1 hypothetical protein A6E13_19025 [Aliivibrio fischeri]OED53414.1 hypothetical protein BEI47_05920 [Aliivibrio fischeri]